MSDRPLPVGKTSVRTSISLRDLTYGGLPWIARSFLMIFFLQPYLLHSIIVILFILSSHLTCSASTILAHALFPSKIGAMWFAGLFWVNANCPFAVLQSTYQALADRPKREEHRKEQQKRKPFSHIIHFSCPVAKPFWRSCNPDFDSAWCCSSFEVNGYQRWTPICLFAYPGESLGLSGVFEGTYVRSHTWTQQPRHFFWRANHGCVVFCIQSTVCATSKPKQAHLRSMVRNLWPWKKTKRRTLLARTRSSTPVRPKCPTFPNLFHLFACCTRIQYVPQETYPLSIYYFLRYKHYSEVRFRILHGARSFWRWKELRASSQWSTLMISDRSDQRTIGQRGRKRSIVIAILRNPLWAWCNVLTFCPLKRNAYRMEKRVFAPRSVKENRAGVHRALPRKDHLRNGFFRHEHCFVADDYLRWVCSESEFEMSDFHKRYNSPESK